MRLTLPPHEVTVGAGVGGAIRASAVELLVAASVTGHVEEERPPEQLAVEHGLVTPENVLAAHGLANIIPKV